MTDIKRSKLAQRIARFVQVNDIIREATLESEREFLKLAGNISTAQLQILLTIGSHNPCTMSKIASIMHFSQANVTQMVNRLIIKRYVKRTPSKQDKRVTYVTLLNKGEKVCQLHKEHVERTATQWFSKMTEEQQEHMLALWEKLIGDIDDKSQK